MGPLEAKNSKSVENCWCPFSLVVVRNPQSNPLWSAEKMDCTRIGKISCRSRTWLLANNPRIWAHRSTIGNSRASKILCYNDWIQWMHLIILPSLYLSLSRSLSNNSQGNFTSNLSFVSFSMSFRGFLWQPNLFPVSEKKNPFSRYGDLFICLLIIIRFIID